MRRRGVGAVAVALLMAVSGCGPFDVPSQLNTSLPQVVGARVTEGQLQVSTGTPCQGTALVSLTFQPGYVRWELKSLAAQGVQVGHVTLGGLPPPGLKITQPLPAGFDWRASKTVQVAVNTAAGGGGSSVDLADIVGASAQHPADTYFFSGFGWLSPAEVAALDGTKFLTPCKPDPAKK